MTLFYFVVASLPVALYLLTLTWVHCRSVPLVVNGRHDFLILCSALSGVFFIGPGQLLVTWGAAAFWGKYVWILIAALCYLVAALIAANLRPRLIIYNVAKDSLKKTLTTTALSLDDEACWSGVSLNMPSLGVQFYVDFSGVGRVASLIQIGNERSKEGWAKFCKALAGNLRQVEQPRRYFASVLFLIISAVLLTIDFLAVLLHGDALNEAVEFYLSV